MLALGALCLPPAAGVSFAQEQGRHTVELGAVGQTTANRITPPYRQVTGVGFSETIGTPNEQIFGGVQLGYRYAFTRNFSLEGRVEYLFGHQPTVLRTGGNELLMHTGIRASLPLGRYSFFATVAPGFSSFSQADGFLSGGSTPIQVTGRINHFSVERSVGVTYRLASRTSLTFSVSDMTLIEGDHYAGYVQPIPCSPPYNEICGGGGSIIYQGFVEEHLLTNIGLERSFGRSLDTGRQTASRGDGDSRAPHNEALFIWANQPQTYLSSGYLAASNGLGGDFSHSFRSWLDLDASALTLPGGDAATFQDGGSKTEVFVGVKAGLRRRYYGVFAKFRPGFVTSPDTLKTDFTGTNPYVRNYNFAADAGAAIEIYPSAQHFVMRFDLGEVGTHYSALGVATSYGGNITEPSRSTEAGLYTFGVGWRF
jgi:hypothetical protein